jgi:anti-sigma regulatory factor (Ser/Thr protein kinase)
MELMTQPMAPPSLTTTAPQESGPWWTRSCTLRFSAQPAACPAARRHLAWILGEWRLAGLTDTAQLLACELLSNAVSASADCVAGPGPIQFRVGRDGASLTIEVGDPSPEPPVARRAGSLDEGGRGLHLVEALSTAWGFCRPPSGGKVVWCQIALCD